MKLTENGINSADAVLTLGRVLACDEFVTGSFVVGKTNTQIWITIIDTRSGTLTDLKLLPFDIGNLEATANDIASFLSQSRLHQNPQQFIALGRFLDMSISSAHEDWAGQLRMLIGKHFHDAGYAVVDNETVSPIFEEFQLEQAGFSESQINRVKFQPSFRLVEGRCKWVRDTNDVLSVAVRVRKPGGSDQVYQFRGLPGDLLASNIIATVEGNLTTVSRAASGQASQEEAKWYEQELNDAAVGRPVMTPLRYSTNSERSAIDQLSNNRKQETIKEAQRALLLNTNNLQAKFMIAFGYFTETNDPALQGRGTQMLVELSTCTNAQIAYDAYHLLAHGHSVIGANGRMNLAIKPVMAVDPERESIHRRQLKQQSLKMAEDRFASNTNDLDAKYFLALQYFTDLDNTTNRLRAIQMLEEFITSHHYRYGISASNILANGIHTSDENGGSILVMPIQKPQFDSAGNRKDQVETVLHPAFTVVDSFSDLTFCALQLEDGCLISKGPKLSFYNLKGEKTDVTCPAKHDITALAADKDFWWLGTAGDGLIRISKSGKPSKTFTEADGLLIPAIKALCLNGGRLWVGFDYRGSGGLGYLNLDKEAFVGMQENADFSTRRDAPVSAIRAADDKSVWVGSDGKLQQYDSVTGRVRRTVPAYFDLLSANSNFLAISAHSGMKIEDVGGVRIYDLKGNSWKKVNLLKDPDADSVTALCVDGQQLWASGIPPNLQEGTFISLVDMRSGKITARYAFRILGFIYWIGVNGNDIWFLAGLNGREVRLCHFSRESPQSQNPDQSSISLIPSKAVSATKPPAASSLEDAQTLAEQRTRFLQENFSKFMPVQFLKGTNGEAAIQLLHVRGNMFENNGKYYAGWASRKRAMSSCRIAPMSWSAFPSRESRNSLVVCSYLAQVEGETSLLVRSSHVSMNPRAVLLPKPLPLVCLNTKSKERCAARRALKSSISARKDLMRSGERAPRAASSSSSAILRASFLSLVAVVRLSCFALTPT